MTKEKKQIQLSLQSSDIEAAHKLQERFERRKGKELKEHKVFKEIRKEYLQPLIQTVQQEKLNDFFVVFDKIIKDKSIDLQALLEIDEALSISDIKTVSQDLILHMDNQEPNRYKKKKKLNLIDVERYVGILDILKQHIEDAQREYEQTINTFTFAAAQQAALLTFNITSTEIAFIILKTIAELGSTQDDQDNNDDELDPDAAATVARNLGESVSQQIDIYKQNKFDNNQKSWAVDEMLLHLIQAELPDKAILNTGMRFISYLEDAGIVNRYRVDDTGEIVQVIDKYNRESIEDIQLEARIGFSDEFKEKIEKIKGALIEVASRYYYPMVVEPLPWKSVVEGGFLPSDSAKYRLTLRKTATKTDLIRLREDANSFPPEILEAINAIQSTPFQINNRLYDALLDALTLLKKSLTKSRKGRNSSLADEKNDYLDAMKMYKLAKNMYKNQPAMLDSIRENFLQVRKRYFDLYRSHTNTQEISEKAEEIRKIESKLLIIDKLRNSGIETEDPIYFVWQMDFRGRIYPVQAHLNPQSDDVGKSLLLFHEAKPLDENALGWLMVHGANTYGKDGLDKKPFEERVKWVDEHSEEIIQTATFHKDSQLLNEAEDRWQFLAFCYEYADYHNDPENFESRLPVGVDGSNNGLQHISSLFKDKASAKLVNVLPDDEGKPQDIYKAVAQKTRETITAELEEFEQKKDKMLKDKEEHYLEKPKSSKKLPENYIDSELIETISQKLSDLNKSKNKKELKYYLEEDSDIVDTCNDLGYLKKSIAQFFANVIQESKEDREKFKQLCFDKMDAFKEGVYYKNRKGKSMQTVVSVFNFINPSIIDLIDRDLVKANVMTDSYGTSVETKQRQIYNKLKSMKKSGNDLLANIDDKHMRMIANHIGKTNDKSIDEISLSSHAYMSWMKGAVKKIYEEGSNIEKPLSWTTPLGLKVTQLKYETKALEITTQFGKDKVYMQYHSNTKKIDKALQKSGFAPNFIHSLDATHLYMTILSAKAKGVSSFMTIHDSFGTHACDIDAMLESLKEQFIILHRQPIMAQLKGELEREYPDIPFPEISEIDETFEIERVADSDYFFA